jgi:hypothetical protein
MARNDMVTTQRGEAPIEMAGSDSQSPLGVLTAGERELMRELIHALRTIRYGSIVLTLHDGRVAEIHKTERIRRNGSEENSAGANHE